MPDVPCRVVCPSCGARYRVPDRTSSGKRMRCLKCREVFVAAVIPAGAGTLSSGHTPEALPAVGHEPSGEGSMAPSANASPPAPPEANRMGILGSIDSGSSSLKPDEVSQGIREKFLDLLDLKEGASK